MILMLESYALEKVLHSSRHGFVQAAVRESDGRAVVLKAHARAAQGEEPSRAQRELGTLRLVAGPGIVEALEVVESSRGPVLVLERLEGLTLQGWLASGLPPVADVLKAAAELAQALGRLHEARLLHRDIRPEHVLIDPATLRAHWIGFGFARPFGSASNDEEDSGGLTGFVGRPHYIAPEQTGRMGRGIDSRSDLYAFGGTLYCALLGGPPFDERDSLALIHAHMAKEPIPPHELSPEIPRTLSRIVLKLLEKEPEARYQSAFALQRDLLACSAALERDGRIDDDLPLATAERPLRPVFAKKLYGRDAEVATLTSAYSRAVEGAMEVLLLSGPPGVGKSALVNELRRVLPATGGHLAAGKLDLYRSDVPYSGLISALTALVHQLLTESEERLTHWREQLGAALGSVAGSLMEYLPDLGFILGELPAPAALGPAETHARLALAVRRFIQCCAQSEHPLALFLDDVQWADPGSFELLEGLLRHGDARHLLVILAYRSTEVAGSAAVRGRIERLAGTALHTTHVDLGPITGEAMTQMLADALHQGVSETRSLAACVIRKTDGNPLLVQQFILHMHAIGLIDWSGDAWAWEETAIAAALAPDGAVALLVAKLERLEARTRELLVFASCVASDFDAERLARLSDRPRPSLDSLLFALAEEGLIAPSPRGFRFAHDRVREAAQALLSEDERTRLHYQIGVRLLEIVPEEEQPAHVFEIVDHLDRGLVHVDEELRVHVAQLNLNAGQRSLAAGVGVTASSYFAVARSLFQDADWQAHWTLGFELWLQSADAAFQTSDFDAALQRLDELERHSLSLIEATRATCKRIQIYAVVQHPTQAASYALAALRKLGVRWPLHPSRLRVEWAVRSVAWRLRGRSSESIVNPSTSFDLGRLAPILILEQGGPIMAQANVRLTTLAACYVLSDYLRNGYLARPGFTLAAYALFSHLTSGDAELTRRMSAAALEWSERVPDPLWGPRTEFQIHALVSPWLMRRSEALRPLDGLTEKLWELGDCEWAYYVSFNRICYKSLGGDDVATTERTLRELAAYAQRGDARYSEIGRLHRVYAPLHAAPDDVVRLDEIHLEGDAPSANSADASEPAIRALWLMTLSVYGRHDLAFAESERGRDRLFRLSPWVHVADHTFYRGLAAAALATEARGALRRRYRAEARRSLCSLRRWQRGGPDFAHMALLIEAELARLGGRIERARQLYPQAAQRAAEQGFVHHAALAHERHAEMLLASRRLAEWTVLLSKAIALYAQWGARGKAHELARAVKARRPEH